MPRSLPRSRAPRPHRLLRPRRLAKATPFALAAALFILGATPIGYQDIASLMAQAPHVAEKARAHMIAPRFAGVHLATFSLPRPVGTHIPDLDPTRVARFDAAANPAAVNRGQKGDLQVPRIQIQILGELLREDERAAEGAPDEAQDLVASLDFKPFPRFDPAMSLDPNDHAQPEAPPAATAEAAEGEQRDADKALYFDPRAALASVGGMQPWDRDDNVTAFGAVLPMPAIAAAPAGADDGEVPHKRVALAPAIPPEALDAIKKSPAERLRLAGASRAKAEKCLATAIYFEARSEPVRGQIAVAQVIVNRAFSGYYPEDICGVVYQNKHRHLSCQFTFACDGIPDVVTEPEHWARAQRIANASLDGKIWLSDVGLATHYHASYVYPYWVRSMRKLKKIGLHTFYRPRKWSEDDAPTWGSPAAAEVVAKM